MTDKLKDAAARTVAKAQALDKEFHVRREGGKEGGKEGRREGRREGGRSRTGRSV